MLTRGTQTQSFQEIFGALWSQLEPAWVLGPACIMPALAEKPWSKTCLCCLSTLSDALRNPIFPASISRKCACKALQDCRCAPRIPATNPRWPLMRPCFPITLMGGRKMGTWQRSRAITRDDLLGSTSASMGRAAWSLWWSVRFRRSRWWMRSRPALGDWQNPSQVEAPALPVVNPPAQPYREHITIAGKSQTDLVMGTLGLERVHLITWRHLWGTISSGNLA